jgi:hypothetical protein
MYTGTPCTYQTEKLGSFIFCIGYICVTVRAFKFAEILHIMISWLAIHDYLNFDVDWQCFHDVSDENQPIQLCSTMWTFCHELSLNKN